MSHGEAKGPGWGGPARGGSSNSEARRPGPGRPPGVKNGEGKRSVADLMIQAGGRELAAERWIAILNDPNHPQHAAMVAKAADRMDGAALQRVEVRDADPDSMTDEELAAIAARGRSAAAGTETA